MNQRVFLCVILMTLLFGFSGVSAYTHKKAILLVDKDLQPDSLGYNFVSDLTSDLYSWIAGGEVVLWDSPEKKSILSYSDLKRVEGHSLARFTRLSNVYIYEYWTSRNKQTSFSVSGFSFIGATFGEGKDIIYGFVEFDIALRNLFQSTNLHVNVNGNSETTLYSALMNMGFKFNLIYFGNTPLTTNKSSEKIIAEAFSTKNKVLNNIPAKQTRLVEYGWDSLSMEQMNISHKIIKTLDSFFNKNQEEFFNYGGDKVYSFLKNPIIHISDFHVIETWTRDKDGKIYFTPQYIVLYAKAVRLQPISFEKLGDWKLQYDDLSLTAFLGLKDYQFEIKKVNETIIPGQLAQSYKDALFADSWYHLAEIH